MNCQLFDHTRKLRDCGGSSGAAHIMLVCKRKNNYRLLKQTSDFFQPVICLSITGNLNNIEKEFQ